MNKNGFTLIELIVLVSLIGIIAGFTGTGILKIIPGIALKSAANDLASDIRLARSLAVKNQETVTMSFDTVGDSYQIVSSTTVYKTVTLSDYRGGIRFGVGNAMQKATKTPTHFPASIDLISFTGDRVNFTRNGMNTKYGYVYLCNENKDIGYAAGLSSLAGVVTFRKTNGSNAWITL